MNNQAEYQKFKSVKEYIIKPMTAMYSPPAMIRKSQERVEFAISEYCKSLCEFSDEQLKTGWEKIRNSHERSIWPAVAEIRRCCSTVGTTIAEAHHGNPWDERDRRAREAVNAYMADLMKNPRHAEAVTQGWAGKLEAYIREAANIQAQLIHGCRNVGFSNIVVPTEGYASANEAFAAYRHTIAEHVSHGKISVSVPASKLQEWQSAGGAA